MKVWIQQRLRVSQFCILGPLPVKSFLSSTSEGSKVQVMLVGPTPPFGISFGILRASTKNNVRDYRNRPRTLVEGLGHFTGGSPGSVQ